MKPNTEFGWHHVHTVNPEWHDAAQWHGQYSPISNESWDHAAHKGYKAEVLRSGPNLVLMQRMQHADSPDTAWIDSLGFQVADLDAALASWTDGGGRILTQQTESAMVADPWGMRAEFIAGAHEGASAHHHVNIAARQPQTLRAWYGEHLGGNPVTCPWDADRLALQYDTYQLVFREVQDGAPSERDGFRHFDHLGWFVEDLEGACADLAAKGVVFPHHALGGKPNPPPPEGPRTPAFAVDPCGIWFELVHCGAGRMQIAKLEQWEKPLKPPG